LDAKPGVYTLLGTELNADGTIMNPNPGRLGEGRCYRDASRLLA